MITLDLGEILGMLEHHERVICAVGVVAKEQGFNEKWCEEQLEAVGRVRVDIGKAIGDLGEVVLLKKKEE